MSGRGAATHTPKRGFGQATFIDIDRRERDGGARVSGTQATLVYVAMTGDRLIVLDGRVTDEKLAEPLDPPRAPSPAGTVGAGNGPALGTARITRTPEAARKLNP
jgi:hypothetical protein